MRAGKLDRRVAIQRKSTTYLDSGEPVETWATLVIRFASLSPLLGEEIPQVEQLVAKEQVEFRLRWETSLSDLSPLDRIIYPAVEATNSPIATRAIYDIMAVGLIGRREALQVRTFRRSDVTS